MYLKYHVSRVNIGIYRIKLKKRFINYCLSRLACSIQVTAERNSINYKGNKRL